MLFLSAFSIFSFGGAWYLMSPIGLAFAGVGVGYLITAYGDLSQVVHLDRSNVAMGLVLQDDERHDTRAFTADQQGLMKQSVGFVQMSPQEVLEFWNT